MPRTHRIDYPDTFHHVMNRAGGKRWPFLRNEHYALFLEELQKAAQRHRVEVHAFCLMTNHFHLLLRSITGNLSLAMQELSSAFTRKYNKMESIDGPLFRGRFVSFPVFEEDYLMNVFQYIHNNPVEAGLVQHPIEYPWSSFQYYNSPIAPLWLTTTHLRPYFSSTVSDTSNRSYFSSTVSDTSNRSKKD